MRGKGIGIGESLLISPISNVGRGGGGGGVTKGDDPVVEDGIIYFAYSPCQPVLAHSS